MKILEIYIPTHYGDEVSHLKSIPYGLNVYNLGSGSSLSVKQIIEAIQKESNTEFEVISKNIERINEIEEQVKEIVREMSIVESKIETQQEYINKMAQRKRKR